MCRDRGGVTKRMSTWDHSLSSSKSPKSMPSQLDGSNRPLPLQSRVPRFGSSDSSLQVPGAAKIASERTGAPPREMPRALKRPSSSVAITLLSQSSATLVSVSSRRSISSTEGSGVFQTDRNKRKGFLMLPVFVIFCATGSRSPRPSSTAEAVLSFSSDGFRGWPVLFPRVVALEESAGDAVADRSLRKDRDCCEERSSSRPLLSLSIAFPVNLLALLPLLLFDRPRWFWCWCSAAPWESRCVEGWVTLSCWLEEEPSRWWWRLWCFCFPPLGD